MIDVKDCPRDQEVDTWFDEEFERQKTRGDKTAPVGDAHLQEELVLKDITDMADSLDKAAVPPHEVDAMMAEMMGDME